MYLLCQFCPIKILYILILLFDNESTRYCNNQSSLQEQEQLEKMRKGLKQEVEFHKKQIKAHEEALKRHKERLDELD